MAGLVADAPSSTSADAQRATWKEIVADAAARARAIGNLPADLEKLVTDWIEPKAPWQEKIAWWFQDRIKGSYTWTKRNRRVPDIYLPSRDDEIQGKIVMAFDTSGSMWFTKDIFKRVLGAISELLAIYKCEADIIDIDTRVSRHTHIAAGENIEKYSPSGGGGTSFVPAFEWTKKNLPSKPDGLIYFTDLEGVFPNEPPDYPVLWVTWREKPGNPPFGALLVIDEK
jgi:predicted metal-dependent peptidase